MQMQILVPITATSQNIKILQIQYGGRPPYWKSFYGYISTIYCPINANLAWRSNIMLDTGHVTKIPNFENSRWRTAAILKMIFSLYLSQESSDFNEMLCADANFGSNNSHVAKYRNFANPICIYCPINAKFGTKKQDHVRHRSHDQNAKFRKFKMADDRHFGLIAIGFSHDSAILN